MWIPSPGMFRAVSDKTALWLSLLKSSYTQLVGEHWIGHGARLIIDNNDIVKAVYIFVSYIRWNHVALYDRNYGYSVLTALYLC